MWMRLYYKCIILISVSKECNAISSYAGLDGCDDIDGIRVGSV